jgi:hypothetical protein
MLQQILEEVPGIVKIVTMDNFSSNIFPSTA